jgi:RND family efflux transporter MFP subunit
MVLFSMLSCQIQIGERKDGERGGKDAGTKKEERIPVEVTSLQRGRIESILKSTTHLEAEEAVRVLARTSNQVKELLVEEGSEVEKGQVILVIEDDNQQVNLSKAQNDVKKADIEFNRQENLYNKNLISDQDFSEIKYSLLQKKLVLEDAQRELEFTRVRAPISGTVTGRFIMLGDQISLGQHLFDIIDFNSLVARIYLPETNLINLELDQPARIQTTALGDRIFKGYVKRIAPVVDSKTGTVKVTIAVGNQKGLKPGMYVDVELVLAVHDHALLIPKRALSYDADQIFVFRLKEDRTVERILVEPVLTDRYSVEVQEGFEEGESIVVAGHTGLKNGSKVSLPGDPEEEPEAEEKGEKTTSEKNDD